MKGDSKLLDEYAPQPVGSRYFSVLIEAAPCRLCGKPTATIPLHHVEPFPYYIGGNLQAQLKRAGVLPAKLSILQHRGPVCVPCSPKITFDCSLCKVAQPLPEQEDVFGDGTDALCKSCYAATPAKQWDELCRELEEAHRYDFE